MFVCVWLCCGWVVAEVVGSFGFPMVFFFFFFPFVVMLFFFFFFFILIWAFVPVVFW